MTFWCVDVFATCNQLKAKGASFAQEAREESWGTMAIFKDPDGNQFVVSSK